MDLLIILFLLVVFVALFILFGREGSRYGSYHLNKRDWKRLEKFDKKGAVKAE